MTVSDGVIIAVCVDPPLRVHDRSSACPARLAVAAWRSLIDVGRGVVPDRLTVDADDDVAVVEAGQLRRRTRLDVRRVRPHVDAP